MADNRVTLEEIEVLKVIERWIEWKPDSRLEHACSILEHVRFGLLTIAQLVEVSNEFANKHNRVFA